MPLTLVVNGQQHTLDHASNTASLDSVLRALGHNPALVVAELNGIIIPKSQWTSQSIRNGDSLEIVTIVGGGS